MIGCPRCKRIAERDGHADWCPQTAEVFTSHASPVTVRYTEPSYVPVEKPKAKGIPAMSLEQQQEKQERGRQKILANLKAKAEAKKPKRKAKSPVKRTQAGGTKHVVRAPGQLCLHCGASMDGRRPIAVYCSDLCRKNAHRKTQDQEIARRAKRHWRTQKAIERTPDDGKRHVCSICQIPKRTPEFGKKRTGKRQEFCRECDGEKRMATMAARKVAA